MHALLDPPYQRSRSCLLAALALQGALGVVAYRTPGGHTHTHPHTHTHWEPADHLQGSLRPPGPKPRKV